MKCLKKILNDFFQKFNHYVIEEVEVSFYSTQGFILKPKQITIKNILTTFDFFVTPLVFLVKRVHLAIPGEGNS